MQSEVGPLGAFGGQKGANDRFAGIGFVIVDLVDHGPIIVYKRPDNRAISPCGTPWCRAEQSRAEAPSRTHPGQSRHGVLATTSDQAQSRCRPGTKLMRSPAPPVVATDCPPIVGPECSGRSVLMPARLCMMRRERKRTGAAAPTRPGVGHPALTRACYRSGCATRLLRARADA